MGGVHKASILRSDGAFKNSRNLLIHLFHLIHIMTNFFLGFAHQIGVSYFFVSALGTILCNSALL